MGIDLNHNELYNEMSSAVNEDARYLHLSYGFNQELNTAVCIAICLRI